MKITENNTLLEILEKPGADAILKQNGVPCMTCPLGAIEINSLQLGFVAKIYGLNLEKILKEINDSLK